MGWFEIGQGFKETVASIKEDTAHSTCVKACYRGSPLNGVLWQVRQSKEGELYIRCDKVEYRSATRSYWNKPMGEGDGPYYYSCPLSYLNIVPVVNPEWRKLVYDRKASKV